jgi:hypothetical protein
VDSWLVSGIQRVASINNGKGFLVDTGVDLPTDPRYWIADLHSGPAVAGSRIEVVLGKVGLASNVKRTWWPVSLYFDMSRDVGK